MFKRIKRVLKSFLNSQGGIAQLPLIIALVILGIALPAAVVLVQRTQEIRKEAGMDQPCKVCSYGECVLIASPPYCSHDFNECSTNANCPSCSDSCSRTDDCINWCEEGGFWACRDGTCVDLNAPTPTPKPPTATPTQPATATATPKPPTPTPTPVGTHDNCVNENDEVIGYCGTFYAPCYEGYVSLGLGAYNCKYPSPCCVSESDIVPTPTPVPTGAPACYCTSPNCQDYCEWQTDYMDYVFPCYSSATCSNKIGSPSPTPKPPTATPTPRTECEKQGGECWADKCPSGTYEASSSLGCLEYPIVRCCLSNPTVTPTPTTFSCQSDQCRLGDICYNRCGINEQWNICCDGQWITGICSGCDFPTTAPTATPTATPKPPTATPTATPKPPTNTPTIRPTNTPTHIPGATATPTQSECVPCTWCTNETYCHDSTGGDYIFIPNGCCNPGDGCCEPPGSITLVPTKDPTITPTPTLSAQTCICSNPAALPFHAKGDGNCDGKTDLVDYNYWVESFIRKNKAYDENADFNCNGVVNISDYGFWSSNFDF